MKLGTQLKTKSLLEEYLTAPMVLKKQSLRGWVASNWKEKGYKSADGLRRTLTRAIKRGRVVRRDALLKKYGRIA